MTDIMSLIFGQDRFIADDWRPISCVEEPINGPPSPLLDQNNLSDVDDPYVALTNLGVGEAGRTLFKIASRQEVVDYLNLPDPYVPPPPAPPNHNYDGRINVRNFGVIPDGITDSLPGMMAAIEYARSRPYGGTVYIPAGTYALKNPFWIDYRTNWMRLDNHVKLVGDGTTQTRFFCWGAGGITLQGNPAQPETHFEMSGMRFTGSGWGTGITACVGAYCNMQDLIFEGFGCGGDFEDIEQSLFTNVKFTWNAADGVIVRGKRYTSDPNSNTFNNCTIAGNKRGMTYYNANAVLFNNGSFQYNGDMSLDPTISYGIKFVNPGSGYGQVKFNTTIFEGNAGCADIWWHADGGLSSLSLDSASAIRISGSKYTNHNVWLTGNSAGSFVVGGGSTFKGFAPYVPSSSRKYFQPDNPNIVRVICPSTIYSSAVEAP